MRPGFSPGFYFFRFGSGPGELEEGCGETACGEFAAPARRTKKDVGSSYDLRLFLLFLFEIDPECLTHIRQMQRLRKFS